MLEETENFRNKALQEKLKQHFKPLGIIAFSNCCRHGCTSTYEIDSDFELRPNGIYFIRLHLNGMNYQSNPKKCYASYDDFDYLQKNWEDEKQLVVQWCSCLGLKTGQYEIAMPVSPQDHGVKIEFEKPVRLD